MMMTSLFGDTLFDGFLNGFAPVKAPEPMRHMIMKTDVKENETGFELNVELPGYKKEDISAELKDGYMTIKAVTNQETEKTEDKFIRRERYSGSCQRSFYVGEAITEEDIKAKFENGILKVEVPKKEAKPEVEMKKTIMIEG